MKRIVIILAFFILHNNASGQDKKSVIIGYNNSNTIYHVEQGKPKNLRRVVMYGNIKDTISVFLNDKLIICDFFSTQIGSPTQFVFDIPFKVKDSGFHFMKIVLSNTVECVEFPLDMRYSFIRIYRMEGEYDKLWYVVFSNEYARE